MNTNKIRDISREQFEEWYSAIVCCDINLLRDSRTNEGGEGFPYRINGQDGEPDFDISEPVSIAWLAWQASREAVVVELTPHEEYRCDTSWEEARQYAYNRALDESRSAIEAQGLKVSP